MYEIITRAKKTDGWTNCEVGDRNQFATEYEAWEAIEDLKKLGDEWAGVEYDVREIKK